jgi:acyl-CoA thioesterase FadM
MEFLRPMAWDEIIDLEVSVEKLGAHSFTLRIDASNAAGDPVFRATITQVTVSPETRRPVPLPAELTAALDRTQGGRSDPA